MIYDIYEYLWLWRLQKNTMVYHSLSNGCFHLLGLSWFIHILINMSIFTRKILSWSAGWMVAIHLKIPDSTCGPWKLDRRLNGPPMWKSPFSSNYSFPIFPLLWWEEGELLGGSHRLGHSPTQRLSSIFSRWWVFVQCGVWRSVKSMDLWRHCDCHQHPHILLGIFNCKCKVA